MQCQAMARRIFKAFSNSLSLSPAQNHQPHQPATGKPKTMTMKTGKNVFMAPKLYNLSLHIKSHRKLGKKARKVEAATTTALK